MTLLVDAFSQRSDLPFPGDRHPGDRGKTRIPKVKFGKFQARSPRLSLSSSMSASLGIDSKMDGSWRGLEAQKPIRS